MIDVTLAQLDQERAVRREMVRRLKARGWLASPPPPGPARTFPCVNACGRRYRNPHAKLKMCRLCALRLVARTRRGPFRAREAPGRTA